MPAVRPRPVTLGSIGLSASRRLTATVGTPIGELAPVVDLQLEISDGRRWCGTRNHVRIEIDRLSELVDVLGRAVKASP